MLAARGAPDDQRRARELLTCADPWWTNSVCIRGPDASNSLPTNDAYATRRKVWVGKVYGRRSRKVLYTRPSMISSIVATRLAALLKDLTAFQPEDDDQTVGYLAALRRHLPDLDLRFLDYLRNTWYRPSSSPTDALPIMSLWLLACTLPSYRAPGPYRAYESPGPGYRDGSPAGFVLDRWRPL